MGKQKTSLTSHHHAAGLGIHETQVGSVPLCLWGSGGQGSAQGTGHSEHRAPVPPGAAGSLRLLAGGGGARGAQPFLARRQPPERLRTLGWG